MLVVTCALIERYEGTSSVPKVLIAQRSESMTHPGLWEFPGGKQEKDESLENCIIREIREELRVPIQIDIQLESCPHNYPDKAIILIPFIVSVEKGEPVLTEHINLAWVDDVSIRDYPLAPADHKVWECYRKFRGRFSQQ